MTLAETVRAVEALLFASAEPLSPAELARRLPEGAPVVAALKHLRADHAGRGVELAEPGGRFSFRTAPDLAPFLAQATVERRPLSKAALETLAIIAYHEPATRAEIEEIRGVSVGADTLGQLMAAGWVRPAGRRETPGRPVQYATTPEFLRAFDLGSRRDLPGLDELRAAGLLDPAPPEEPGLL
jgi:segregation and condensation protein B